MRIPIATYRVQFNKDFRFADATSLVPKLNRLGITHLYASPIWAAREGSTHGYDVVDPNRLNPALGTREDFDELVSSLRAHAMGLVVDIVPNHMAASPENKWWMDVLESGSASPYCGFFGINWNAVSETPGEKIFLPILGSPYGSVLEGGELKLAFEDDGLFVRYYDHKVPVTPASYWRILDWNDQPFAGDERFLALSAAMERLPLPSSTDWDALEAHSRDKHAIKQKLADLYASEPAFHEHLDRRIAQFNGTPGDPASFDALDDVLQMQPYRLAHWRVAMEKINYRRFFDVTDLIGMRVDDPSVFQRSHTLLLEMVERGEVEGIRVDHIDGLAEPAAYVERLPSDKVYVIAEKILVGEERMPRDWKLHGTTGYEYLGYANALFVDPEGATALDQFYKQHTGNQRSLDDWEYERKVLVINSLFPGEMADLAASLGRLAECDRHARDFSPSELARGLKEITACMPVYRTYTQNLEVSERDRPFLMAACSEAARRCPLVDTRVYDFICRVLTMRFGRIQDESQKKEWLRFVKRWQQLSGPIMAKGVEDSAFYMHNRLVSLNEVGAIPRPVPRAEMHAFLAERQQQWPHSMNANSTHDTKRSEDVRARINVLSELAAEWARLVPRWSRWLAPKRNSVDVNEEYMLLQNLLGAWPLHAGEIDEFRERFKGYSTKAAREAREYTNWLTPNEAHENDLHSFIDELFTNERFLASFLPLQSKASFYGAVNSLSQVLLKATAPGLPDFYRGTIDWDFSLVDPDNRRPVSLPDLTDFEEPARATLEHWQDGKAKVFLTEKCLALRKSKADLFERGEYIPLETSGKRAENIFAFARRLEDQWVVVAVPRLSAKLSAVMRFPLGITAWRDTIIHLPDEAPRTWRSVITGGRVKLLSSELPAYRALEQFPVALLTVR